MKLRLFTILFAMMFTAAFAADDGVQLSFGELEKFLGTLDGVVVSIEDKSTLLVDIGAEKNAVPGLKLGVYSGETDIVHPLTGKILGKREVNAGHVVLTKVYAEYSEASYTGDAPVVGSRVGLTFPVKLKVNTDNLTDEDNTILNGILGASTVFQQDAKAPDYVLELKRGEGVISYSMSQTDGVVLCSGTVVLFASSYDYQFKAEYRKALPAGRYLSIAAGTLYKDDPLQYVAAVLEDELHILDPEKDFALKEEVDGEFSKIVAVECADLDGNGIAEIYVSNYLQDRGVYSSIIQHDGKEFVAVDSKIPWMFRSFRQVDDRRQILAQKISKDGAYNGEIYDFIYKDGKFQAGTSLKGSLGKQLFGFSILPKGGKSGDDLFINIDKGSHMALSTFRGTEYTAPGYYGDTFHNFAIRAMKRARNSDVSAYYEKLIFVTPRVEIIDGKYFVAVQNGLAARAFTYSPVFTESSLSMFSYEYGMMKKLAFTDQLEPVLVDLWSFREGGRQYMYVLVSSNNWGFQKGESAIRLYEIVSAE